MDEMAYVAMTGLKQTEVAQAINSNNLANVSTAGFRADLHAFSYSEVTGPGSATRVNAVAEQYGTDFRQGPTASTGRDLDIAIQDNGFIAVEAADGSEAYTRAGDLRVSTGGILTTGTGTPGDRRRWPGRRAAQRESAHRCRRHGVDSAPGSDGTDHFDRRPHQARQPEIGDLVKGPDGLLRMKSDDIAPADAAVQITAGALEQSNVNVASTLVNMIELARQYEMQVNVIKTAEEDADVAASLLRMS